MATNEYVYTRFICSALQSILSAPASDCSPKDRVRMILDSSFSIRESDLPDQVRQDWQNIMDIRGIKVPTDLRKLLGANKAKVLKLTPTQTRKVLTSFWSIARAVVNQRTK
jgi:hypothetical protein